MSTTSRLLAGSAVGLAFLTGFPARSGEILRLESPVLALSFDRSNGTLRAATNKLTGETYGIEGDQFSIETTDFRVNFRDATLVSLRQAADRVEAVYSHARLGIEVAYTLGASSTMPKSAVALTFKQPCGVKRVILSQPSFSGTDLRIVPYRYPKFMRKPGSEPSLYVLRPHCQRRIFHRGGDTV